MARTQTLERLVVVGFGWVGQANALALSQLGEDVSFYDPSPPERYYAKYDSIYDSLLRLTDVLQKDSADTWYIVCVGDRVSEDGVQDISLIKGALESLKAAKGGVVLRSTIIPDLLESLRFDYYMPEFLHEKKAVEESLDPYFFVLGSRSGVRAEPHFFSIWRQRAHKVFSGSPREASFIKYLSNLWNATRIAFVNEFGNAIGRPKDKERLGEIERIVNFLFDNRMYQRYGRSFGGHCLPKDSRAFRAWYGKNAELPLISGMYASNSKHALLEKEYPLLPEWYSQWPDQHISGWRALSELLYALRKNILHPLSYVRRRKS